MFSKTLRYSMRSILLLAARSHEQEKMSIVEIARALETSKPVMAGVMQQMARQGLITSKKGRNGGFYLTQEQRAQSMSKVLNSMAEDTSTIMNACLLGRKSCDGTLDCPYSDEVNEIRNTLQKIYQKTTLQELAKDIYKSS